MEQPPRTILIVDDIVDDLLMFEDSIEEMGNIPWLALTPQDARDFLKKGRPDLIVWNTDVPKSWDELKNLFKNRATKDIPVIAVVNERGAESALKLGCIGLMRKPIAEGIIAEVLSQGLRPSKASTSRTAKNQAKAEEARAARAAKKKTAKAKH